MSVIVITGRSCSGKSSVQKELIFRRTYKRGITCTTRQRRPDEVDGVHYHFLSKAEFLKKIAEGCFAENSEYAGNLYGSLKKDLQGDDIKVLVLDSNGAFGVKEALGNNALVIFLRVDRETAESAFRSRGDSEKVIKERLKEDETAFNDVPNFADVIIDNSGFKMSISDVANIIDTVAKSVF